MLCHHTWPSWHGPAVEVSGDDDDDDDDDDLDMNVVHQNSSRRERSKFSSQVTIK